MCVCVRRGASKPFECGKISVAFMLPFIMYMLAEGGE